MAIPSEKSPKLEQEIKDFFGIDRVSNIMDDICVSCKGAANEFDDELSKKEYTISGLCQKCQNQIFGPDL